MKGKYLFIIIAVLFCGLSNKLAAQTAYAGGAGDGYAMGEVTGVYLGIEQPQLLSLQIMPNPVKIGGSVFIQNTNLEKESVMFQLSDPSGRLIFSKIIIAQPRMELPLAGIPCGAYILKMYDGDQVAYAKVLIIP